MQKTLTRLTLALSAAVSITATPFDPPFFDAPLLAPIVFPGEDTPAAFEAIIGFDPGSRIYKSDFGGLAGFSSIHDANIAYIDFAGAELPFVSFLTLMAGDDNGFVIYSLIGWVGETIRVINTEIVDDLGNPRNVSHIIIWGDGDDIGDNPPPVGVPDSGASFLLLAMGLGLVGLYGRSITRQPVGA